MIVNNYSVFCLSYNYARAQNIDSVALKNIVEASGCDKVSNCLKAANDTVCSSEPLQDDDAGITCLNGRIVDL